MVERMNRSTEDIMKKLLENKGDWEDMLPLVLFSVGASRHSSTGISPFRLMFQHDPIHPFEFMDRLKHDGDKTVNASVSEFRAEEMFEKMERLRIEYSSVGRETENRAMKKIKQSQERMSKYYNLQNVGVKFKVGDKVPKKNVKDTSRLEKLRKKYVGPYMIRDIAPSGNYYLTDSSVMT